MGQRLDTLTVERARGAMQRLLGLIGRRELGENEAMLFECCSAIHTLFMRIPIDVLFIDRRGRIVRAIENLRPWRLCAACPGATRVVELAPGTIARRALRVGDDVALAIR